jgi:SRSO17 transposase
VATTVQPAKYFFSNLPATMSPKRLVATAQSRWGVEHSYRELKDDLGLDHFKGRSGLAPPRRAGADGLRFF